jgi:RNase P subunit RPR2
LYTIYQHTNLNMARPNKNPDFVSIKCHTCGKEHDVKYQKRNKQRFCSRVCSVNNIEVK